MAKRANIEMVVVDGRVLIDAGRYASGGGTPRSIDILSRRARRRS